MSCQHLTFPYENVRLVVHDSIWGTERQDPITPGGSLWQKFFNVRSERFTAVKPVRNFDAIESHVRLSPTESPSGRRITT